MLYPVLIELQNWMTIWSAYSSESTRTRTPWWFSPKSRNKGLLGLLFVRDLLSITFPTYLIVPETSGYNSWQDLYSDCWKLEVRTRPGNSLRNFRNAKLTPFHNISPIMPRNRHAMRMSWYWRFFIWTRNAGSIETSLLQYRKTMVAFGWLGVETKAEDNVVTVP